VPGVPGIGAPMAVVIDWSWCLHCSQKLESSVESWKMKAAKYANASSAAEGIPPAVVEWEKEKLSELETEASKLQGVVDRNQGELAVLQKIISQRDDTIAKLTRQLESSGLARADDML
jgi:hypothetical protein